MHNKLELEPHPPLLVNGMQVVLLPGCYNCSAAGCSYVIPTVTLLGYNYTSYTYKGATVICSKHFCRGRGYRAFDAYLDKLWHACWHVPQQTFYT